jgi:hypothetical protein
MNSNLSLSNGTSSRPQVPSHQAGSHFIHHWEDLQVGENYLWDRVDESSYAGARLARIFSFPLEKRICCFLDSSFQIQDKIFVCFLFDLPYNNQPTNAEQIFVKYYRKEKLHISSADNNNEESQLSSFEMIKHVFLLPASTWKNQGIVLSRVFSSLSSKSFVKCKLSHCYMICRRYQLIRTCESNSHHCCYLHFMPTTEEELKWTDDTRDFIIRKMPSGSATLSYLEAGVRYLFLVYKQFPKIDIKRSLQIVMQTASFACPFCLLEDKMNICGLDLLDHQFQNPLGVIIEEEVEDSSVSQRSSLTSNASLDEEITPIEPQKTFYEASREDNGRIIEKSKRNESPFLKPFSSSSKCSFSLAVIVDFLCFFIRRL